MAEANTDEATVDLAETLVDLELVATPDVLDDDNYATLWNIASSTVGGDYDRTRFLANTLLLFLCKNRFPYVVASNTDMQYLDEWLERDNKLLYDWTPQSEMVDVVAQHACVPFDTLRQFLNNHRFKIDAKYTAKRSLRVEWFKTDWNVG